MSQNLEMNASDESQLTAFALGELEGTERAAVEQRLAQDESARRFVAEIRVTAQDLKQELAREKPAGLGRERRAALEQQLAAAPVQPDAAPRPTRVRAYWAQAALAATVLLAAGGGIWMQHQVSTLKSELNQATSRMQNYKAEGQSAPTINKTSSISGAAQAPSTREAQEKSAQTDSMQFQTEPYVDPGTIAAATKGDHFETPSKPKPSPISGPAAPTVPSEPRTNTSDDFGTGHSKFGFREGTGRNQTPAPINAPDSPLPPIPTRPPMDPAATLIAPAKIGDESVGGGGMGWGGGRGVGTAKDESGAFGMRQAADVGSGRRKKDSGKKEEIEQLKSEVEKLRESLNKHPSAEDSQSPPLRADGYAENKYGPFARTNNTAGINYYIKGYNAKTGGTYTFPTDRYGRITWITPPNPAHGEAYAPLNDNPFQGVLETPLSTFSIDVDTASYANVRRFLNQGQLPPPDAVRIEELLNYFSYDYPQPKENEAFAGNVEIAQCPWAPEHRLVRVGLKGRAIATDKRPPSNLVFLIDVSGSMDEPNKLPLVRKGLKQMVEHLGENDRVAIAVYAGASGMALESTSCAKQEKILKALDRLSAGGSTNGAAGIELAYQVAVDHFIRGGVNRVILCTDGDWNVGVTNQEQLTGLIAEKAKSGVFLSVLGFGMGNLKDGMLEKLADQGNGNYAYIDTLEEAHKALVEQMSGTLVTIAKDVKIQVEFNPARAAAYRLIGYENRILAKEDFNNDRKDAGEIGAGHTVTALYEVIPADRSIRPTVDPLKYQADVSAGPAALSEELLTLKVRYKAPDGDTSRLIECPVTDKERGFAQASPDFRFAAAVASFGMLLRGSPYRGQANFEFVREVAEEARGSDEKGYRREFLELVKKAKTLAKTGRDE